MTTEDAKYKNGYGKAKKAVIDFMAKAKEKAKDAFADGFCLARKQVFDRNPKTDLSSLNGLVRPAWSAEWFFTDFLKPALRMHCPRPKALPFSLA